MSEPTIDGVVAEKVKKLKSQRLVCGILAIPFSPIALLLPSIVQQGQSLGMAIFIGLSVQSFAVLAYMAHREISALKSGVGVDKLLEKAREEYSKQAAKDSEHKVLEEKKRAALDIEMKKARHVTELQERFQRGESRFNSTIVEYLESIFSSIEEPPYSDNADGVGESKLIVGVEKLKAYEYDQAIRVFSEGLEISAKCPGMWLGKAYAEMFRGKFNPGDIDNLMTALKRVEKIGLPPAKYSEASNNLNLFFALKLGLTFTHTLTSLDETIVITKKLKKEAIVKTVAAGLSGGWGLGKMTEGKASGVHLLTTMALGLIAVDSAMSLEQAGAKLVELSNDANYMYGASTNVKKLIGETIKSSTDDRFKFMLGHVSTMIDMCAPKLESILDQDAKILQQAGARIELKALPSLVSAKAL